jgi:hypothetical protein
LWGQKDNTSKRAETLRIGFALTGGGGGGGASKYDIEEAHRTLYLNVDPDPAPYQSDANVL